MSESETELECGCIYSRRNSEEVPIEEDPTILTHKNYKTFPQTEENVNESIEYWGPTIEFVEDRFITYELCKRAIERHSGSLSCIKRHLLSPKEYYDLCLQTVKSNGFSMKFVPSDVHTQELCDAAIQSSCWAITHCLDKFKTPQNCLQSVSKNGQTLEYVPTQYITQEMCLIAVKTRYPCLNLIPKEFITQEVCDEAVKANGENVKYVPDEFMSTALAAIAIRSPAPCNPSANMAGANIQYIPAKYITKELILESVRRWFSTYHRIPKECITDEIEEEVLKISPYCIKHIKQTPERCWQALKENPTLIEYIARENITQEMAQFVFSNLTKKHLKYINNDLVEYLRLLL